MNKHTQYELLHYRVFFPVTMRLEFPSKTLIEVKMRTGKTLQ